MLKCEYNIFHFSLLEARAKQKPFFVNLWPAARGINYNRGRDLIGGKKVEYCKCDLLMGAEELPLFPPLGYPLRGVHYLFIITAPDRRSLYSPDATRKTALTRGAYLG